MNNKTIGIVLAIIGVLSFLYSFSIETSRQVYFWAGIMLVVGGLLYARFTEG